MNNQTKSITRLAPSPTGALHLGNARTFMINWAAARRNEWNIIFRMEDIDGPRVKPQACEQAIDILLWLGINWDDGPFYQVNDLKPYQSALMQLMEKDLVYPCTCSRKDIEMAQSAPHDEDHELRYPGTCRAKYNGNYSDSIDIGNREIPIAWRLKVPDEQITFKDTFKGTQTFNIQHLTGDFVVATKSGLPAYQLAVVVDDARQKVTHVIRGDDLLSSTARQLLLYTALDLKPPHCYLHLPLIYGPDGKRLAKRHGDTRISHYREVGVAAERIIGLIAYWSGLLDTREEISASGFLEKFNIDKIPADPIVYCEEDEKWLMAS